MTSNSNNDIESSLSQFPPPVLEAFQEASEAMDSAFNDEEFNLWAKKGVSIAGQTVRSWESAVEYYRVGSHVARALAFPSFMQGAQDAVHTWLRILLLSR
ncbi:MAG: hypothetical protein CM1200mP15_04910 [Dehalococcoidia bacterium]|nr:MAG: hypothetical protein CM1200mP15_04910 [Dehalococcoidia bacterium]